jgi:hypothetical protein
VTKIITENNLKRARRVDKCHEYQGEKPVELSLEARKLCGKEL